jgi:outer membrane biosynthesis protein TonB
MSLEDSINKLTLAVETLNQSLNSHSFVTFTTGDTRSPAYSVTTQELSNPEPAPAPTVEPEAPKKPRKKAAAPVAEPAAEPEVTIAVEPEVTIAVEPEPVAEPVKITLHDIRELAQVALDNDKLSDVIAINKKFGLRRISEASETQYAEIHEILTKLTHGAS